MKTEAKHTQRIRRHTRVRARISGTATRPRLAVFRSNRHLSAQLIDDTKGKTLVSVFDREVAKKKKAPPLEIAKEIGKLAAAKAQEKKVKEIVFDRGGYAYHGSVKALAEGAREGGLKF